MSPAARGRLRGAGWAVGAALVGAAYTQAEVQVLSRDQILAKARDGSRLVVGRTDLAKRGSIMAADGKVLASSEDTFELVVSFEKVPKSPGFFMDLAAATGIPAPEFATLSESGVRSRTWTSLASSAVASDVQRVKTRWRADGVSLRQVLMRDYPLAESSSGFVGSYRDGRPASGLELSRDAALRGEDGYREGMVDRTGAFLPMRMTGASRSRSNGETILLTIDSSLQIAATNAIRHAVELNKATSGVAIMLDPKTGDLLAMANWPSFDPNGQPGIGAVASDFNTAYMAAFEPGSTFKVLTLAKALDRGKVGLGDRIACTGILQYNEHWRIRCDLHHGTRAHGSVDPEMAIAKSCNVAAATWALKVGRDDMIAYFKDLGVLERTKLGLPLERGGLFDLNEYAKPLQLMNVGFGQAIATTPVALAGAFAMLANEGRRVTPRIVASIGDRPTAVGPPTQVVAPETARQVLKLMEAVIQTDRGTGRTLRIPGYRLAGKTGTAQKVDHKTGRIGGGYVSSFVGYVPADQPRAVILVMVDDPKGAQYYGAQVAGPVFLELARAAIRHFRLAPGIAG